MPSADLKAYLAEAYTVEAISADICDPSKHLLVATRASFNSSASSSDASSNPSRHTDAVPAEPADEVVGFAQLTQNSTDPSLSHLPQNQLIELQRLYVHPSAQGHGLGKLLMREIEKLAKDMGYRYMWLGVWEGNFIAQRVYESAGFERVGEHEFVMGRCIQMDWIMVKELC